MKTESFLPNAALERLVSLTRFGLICDFDGTLSPIVAEPSAAQLAPRNRDLLAQLADVLPFVAIVSGRGVADLYDRVALASLLYAGNHGLEQLRDGRVESPPTVKRFRPALQAAADQLAPDMPAGGRIEDKGATLSIHVRQTSDTQAAYIALAPVVAALASQHGLRHVAGRMVYELRPPLDIDKGTVVADLVVSHALEAALYLGDDSTDADAMRALASLRQPDGFQALGGVVLTAETPSVVRAAADFSLSGTDAVTELLAWLLAARSASPT